MGAVLLDTHVVHWWSAEPQRVSTRAKAELAWLAEHERIVVTIPVSSWLMGLAAHVRTIGLTPAVADTAVALPSSFPADPADRLIFATAIEHGLQLVTKDQAIRDHAHPRSAAIW